MEMDGGFRCPACGSALISPREDPEIWECRYCYAVFPVEFPLPTTFRNFYHGRESCPCVLIQTGAIQQEWHSDPSSSPQFFRELRDRRRRIYETRIDAVVSLDCVLDHGASRSGYC